MLFDIIIIWWNEIFKLALMRLGEADALLEPKTGLLFYVGQLFYFLK